MSTITPQERKRLADMVGINEQYLYQCLTGRASMEAKEASRVERETGSVLRRWHLRTHDWNLVWPELVGTMGAPPVPAKAAA